MRRPDENPEMHPWPIGHPRHGMRPSPMMGRPPPGGPPPGGPHGGMFGHPFFPPPPHGAPPPPVLDPESIKQLKTMFILQQLADNAEGMTGYQLSKTSFPRTTIIRTMDELVEEEYVIVKEDMKENRMQKYYIITESGLGYLGQLKEELAIQFYTFAEMAPPEHFGNPFIRKGPRHRLMREVSNLKDKQHAIDFFSGIRARVTSFKERVSKRLERLDKTENNVSAIIEEIERMDSLDIEKIKELVKNIRLRSESPEMPEEMD
ncbi:MAG: hypothetical protein ACFFCS_15590 [Candidatus Hodarchaeota archaeon]